MRFQRYQRVKLGPSTGDSSCLGHSSTKAACEGRGEGTAKHQDEGSAVWIHQLQLTGVNKNPQLAIHFRPFKKEHRVTSIFGPVFNSPSRCCIDARRPSWKKSCRRRRLRPTAVRFTLPETNGSPLKMLVVNRNLPFRRGPLFSGARLLVLGRLVFWGCGCWQFDCWDLLFRSP